MAKFIIGKKMEMTQKFKPDGIRVPVTRVQVEPCAVVQVKTKQRDGYSAVQIGFGSRRHINKPLQGHLAGLKSRHLKEFIITPDQEGNFSKGDSILVSSFIPGDIIKVTGWSKGRGFQGVVKRHDFRGSPKTHGHKDQLRMPGSSGAGGKQHVLKGKKMPGHMGDEQVTVTNLTVVEVDEKNNSLFVKGAVPGARNSLLYLVGAGEIKVGKKTAAAPAENTPAAVPPAEVPAQASSENAAVTK